MLTVTSTPTAYKITKYDENAYLNSTTPASGDSSTKVATTAFVGTAIAAITASDVGALADDSVAAGITSTDISNWNAKLSSFTETDPTVPPWAKASSKPTYTASEVGAVTNTLSGGQGSSTSVINNSLSKISLSNTNQGGTSRIGLENSKLTLQAVADMSAAQIDMKISDTAVISITSTQTIIKNIITPVNDTDAANKKYVDDSVSGITHPVTSVNTKTGAVTLSASDVGAVAKSGDTMTGNLNMGSKSITFTNTNADSGATTTLRQASASSGYGDERYGYLYIDGCVQCGNIPTYNYDLTNKQYVDNKFSSISVPQPYNATTNPTGYLTINDLPIYDGTVV